MVTIAAFIVILFILWQFKMLKKYALGYDKFKINTKERYVSVNGERINFDEIDFITVRELEQPSVLEKTLSKSAFYAYIAKIEFHLIGGAMIPCVFNYKGALYNALKQLQPYVQINGDISYFKPRIAWRILILMTMGIMFSIILALKRG